VDYRLPELYSGAARGSVPTVVPYPAACRPQAWSAAAAVSVLAAALGLQPDVPNGSLRLDPPSPSPFGAVRASGLTLGGLPLAVAIDARGEVVHVAAAADVRVTRGAPSA
jgi:glycogen debranching enzyme